ncbi:MAG: plasmid mobilization relaxosome protein MobC [Erysipelotrichaceae bacterium]
MRKRVKGILIRVTDDEFRDLTSHAQERGISREQYIRVMVLEHKISRPLLPSEFHETIKQLRAIGNNINQIAMVANRTGAIDATMYRDERMKLDNEILNIRRIASEPMKLKVNNVNHMEEI